MAPITNMIKPFLLSLALPIHLTLATPILHPGLLPRLEDTCTEGVKIPNLWSAHDLKIIYSTDDGRTPSNASFAITHTRTNVTESLRCNLRANYQCSFNGTPKNPNLSIWLQLNLLAYFSFTESQACEGKTASIMGMAEMELFCDDVPLEDGRTCTGETKPAFATGTVEVEQA